MLENYIVLDLEMTGLHPKNDKILEIGAIKVREKQVTDIFSVLVNPKVPLSEKVQELTGITGEMAENGVDEEEALKRFLEFAGEDIWVGHNVIFDYSFIKQWTVNHKMPFQKSAVDTLKIARVCLPQLEKKTLDYLCEYFNIHREKSHRALEDAKATRVLYEMLEAEYYKKTPEMFFPKELQYKAKRQTLATLRQKKYLKDLTEYHKINLDVSMEQLSRSEASRLTDKIIQKYGKLQVSAVPDGKRTHP